MRSSLLIFAASLFANTLPAEPTPIATSTDAALDTTHPVSLRESLAPVDLIGDPSWSDLLKHLGTPKTRLSAFVEARYFPFRRTPVELQGEIRIIPEQGLSLRYLEPKEQILIVDAQGVLMRDEKGRQRRAPNDSRATAMSNALTDILRFDLPSLQQEFDLRGAQVGSTWMLEFSPHDATLAHQLGTITVDGKSTQLSHIEMRKSNNQRIEITIGETTENVTFSAADIARFFR